MSSPYFEKDVSEWKQITEDLIAKHPLKSKDIVDVVLKSWNDIFNSKIGAFTIGREIFPSPQIMSFFLHELIAHYLSLEHPGLYKVGTNKDEKDIHCIKDNQLSVEIKASTNPNQIFANRSYAQPDSGKGQKEKSGYYITVNFAKHSGDLRAEILLIEGVK